MTNLPLNIVTIALAIFAVTLYKDFFPADLRLQQRGRRLVVSMASLILAALSMFSGSAVIAAEVEPTENQKVDWIE